MIGHQSIVQDGDALLTCMLAQEVKIDDVAGITEEDVRPAVPALSDVMRDPRVPQRAQCVAWVTGTTVKRRCLQSSRVSPGFRRDFGISPFTSYCAP